MYRKFYLGVKSLSWLTQWVMGIVGAAVLGVLADILMPQGNTKKYINSVLALIMLFVILSPIPTLLNSKWDINAFFGKDSIQANKSIVDNINKQQISIIENALEAKLKEDGYPNASVKIAATYEKDTYKIKLVNADFSDCIIPKDKQSFYENMKTKVKGYLNDNSITVIIYG